MTLKTDGKTAKDGKVDMRDEPALRSEKVNLCQYLRIPGLTPVPNNRYSIRMHIVLAVLSALMVLNTIGRAQNPADHSKDIEFFSPIRLTPHLKRTHNSAESLRRELLDTNTILLVARAAGVKSNELVGFRVGPGLSEDSLNLFVSQKADDAKYKPFSEMLDYYIESRLNGHTKEYVDASLNYKIDKMNLVHPIDPDLQLLINNQPLIPSKWLKKMGESRITDTTGTLTKIRVDFSLVDDGIDWRYTVSHNPDGSFEGVSMFKHDAKEINPKYKEVMREVDDEITAAMRKDGTLGKFGSGHLFTSRKKEELQRRGIEWQSVEDLNPGIIGD